MNRLLKYGTMVLAIVFVLVSCDTDPTELGGDFLGIDIDGTIVQQDFEAKSFSAPLNPVQTNNFSSMLLGTYVDPVYGKTTYDFVTQLSLANPNVNFGEDRRLDSVVLSIPYFSTRGAVTSEGTEYRLDSVYGNDVINFKVYRSNYFLNSFDPTDVDQAAAFYSDFGAVIDDNKGEEIKFLLTNSNDGSITEVNEITEFLPSNKEIELKEINDEGVKEVTGRLAPRFRQQLEKSFWKNLIIDNGGASYLTSDSNFQNFFRGLYFKVTGSNGGGNLSYLNLADAQIILYYTSDILDSGDFDNDGSTTDLLADDLASTFIINLAGNRINLLQTETPAQVISDISGSFDPVNGSEKIYLKGGPGAMAFVDLFGPDLDNDGEADALTELRAKNVLVNEANLEFYVDQNSVTSGDTEPERIVVYDFETSRYLADFEITSNGAPTQNLNHLGRLERESGSGFKYKVRLTNHIAQILSGNIENHRLAVVVSQNVGVVGFSKVKNQTQPLEIGSIPRGSAISHEGTVLHGNLSSDPAKRLKLKVFYTQPN